MLQSFLFASGRAVRHAGAWSRLAAAHGMRFADTGTLAPVLGLPDSGRLAQVPQAHHLASATSPPESSLPQTSSRAEDPQAADCAVAAPPPASAQQEAAGSRRSDKDMMAIFTCTKCDTRTVKAFSRRSYDQGVVIVRCPGCQNLHLLADRLGWFGDKGSLEDFMAASGAEVVRRAAAQDGTLELTAEDIVGRTRKQATATTDGSSS